MSIEQTPTETTAPEAIAAPAADAAPVTKSGRATAIFTACVLLALPLAYVALHRSGSTPQAATAAAGPNIAALEEAVRTNPTAANRINLSQAYIQGNTPARAVPVLQDVIAADANNQIAWNNLCVAHTMQQDYKPALEECNRAVAINPAFQLARNNLKWTQDENDKTIQSLATMEQTAPSARDAKFYLSEGMQFLHVGNYDQAIQSWQRALQLDPQNSIAANNIGTSYMFEKQPKLGAQWFQKALDIDPAFQLAKNNLAWANGEVVKTK